MVGLLSPLLSKASLKGSPELPLPHTRDITSEALPSVKDYKSLRPTNKRPYLGFVELSLELESSLERVLVHRA